MDWSQVERRQPRLAELGRERLVGPGVVLVGTVRADGSARISPVEPFLMDGSLWLSMLWGSMKAADLVRDPRILVHSIVASRDGRDGEFKVRGTARSEQEDAVLCRYAGAAGDALGWRPVPGRFHLFEVDIDDITYVRYDDATGDQFVVRWPDGCEFVRRGTTPTSLGEPEVLSQVLVDS